MNKNKVKTYFINQTKRPVTDLMFDIIMVCGVLACVYYGFSH